jgi:UDP-4-amino-4,6-dideoxy-N-acetyl-beta-L-altrosamine transaminase
MKTRAHKTAAPSKELSYGRQTILQDDIDAVVKVLRSDWLTTGPAVEGFEKAIADFTGAKHAVAVSSGTAALHAAVHALGIGPGDEVIVPPITFAATANSVAYCGGTPVFADVKSGSLLLDPTRVREKITSRTRAIIAVDYAGQPCDYDELTGIARRHKLALVADACHALGATYKNRPAGQLADITAFSFHPVKHITTGEGGMVTTNNAALAGRVREFRNHCITADHRTRRKKGSYFYEMVDLGFNYRLSDFQCALGTSQLKKLPAWLEFRKNIARDYDQRLAGMRGVRPLEKLEGRTHAYHLYVVKVESKSGGSSRRDKVFGALRAQGIHANVHYLPVYLHPFYRTHFRYKAGLCPVAEAAYREILSLPIHPQIDASDVVHVVSVIDKTLRSKD